MIVGILTTAVVQGVITVIGHEAIRYLERVAGILLLVLGAWITYIILSKWSMREVMNFAQEQPKYTVAFFIDLAFGFSWTWAQIADFSRFAKTANTATTGTWLGVNVGQGWFMLMGALGVIGVALQQNDLAITLRTAPLATMTSYGARSAKPALPSASMTITLDAPH